ncbi:hypothetical protein T10_12000 [Trichinella papuae]|uniref:Uncharacterized protein n=1 Tax=Trichinella papuae TaxID=268474 RepID=A0A0V1N1L5_9BILA|nr:hypothetical protein T10_12000 [Trichinella papuae]
MLCPHIQGTYYRQDLIQDVGQTYIIRWELSNTLEKGNFLLYESLNTFRSNVKEQLYPSVRQNTYSFAIFLTYGEYAFIRNCSHFLSHQMNWKTQFKHKKNDKWSTAEAVQLRLAMATTKS